MKIIETLNGLNDQSLNKDFLTKLESYYGITFPNEVRKVLSISKDTVFFDEDFFIRLLSNNEIMDASGDMAVDFLSYSIIPIFDVGDNDYICYDIASSTWCKFNIVDEIKFSNSDLLLGFFE